MVRWLKIGEELFGAGVWVPRALTGNLVARVNDCCQRTLAFVVGEVRCESLTSFWISDALRYSLFGFMGGCFLGLLGLALTRWEDTPQALHYTPNRWLISIITLVVTARLLYGVWRIWNAWSTSGSDTSWLEEAGVAGSLALAAILLGYYVTYSAGLRWRLRRRDKT